MDIFLFISLLVVIVNIILSSVIPCIFKETDQPFINNVKKIFQQNKQLILTNSIILGITVYIALQLAPVVNSQFPNLLGDTNSSTASSSESDINELLSTYNDSTINNPQQNFTVRRVPHWKNNIPNVETNNPFKFLSQL